MFSVILILVLTFTVVIFGQIECSIQCKKTSRLQSSHLVILIRSSKLASCIVLDSNFDKKFFVFDIKIRLIFHFCSSENISIWLSLSSKYSFSQPFCPVHLRKILRNIAIIVLMFLYGPRLIQSPLNQWYIQSISFRDFSPIHLVFSLVKLLAHSATTQTIAFIFTFIFLRL